MVDEADKVAIALERFTEELMRRLTLEITANLVEATPVDTGWARANWVPAIGVAVLNPVEFRTRDDRAAAVGGQQGAQQSGIASILGYQLERGRIFISNGVPYILALNEGSSQQAPRAFVQTTIRQTLNSLDAFLPSTIRITV